MVQLETKLGRENSDTCISLYHTAQLLTTAIGSDVTSLDTNVQAPLPRVSQPQDTCLL